MLGKHITSGSLFLSNFILLKETGYFDVAAELKPLLHLWSLGIEEQFYIIWPLLIFLSFRLRLRVLWLTSSIAGLSFCINIWQIDGHLVQTFYNPVTRFWELMAGALLASVTIFSNDLLVAIQKRFRDVLSFVGIMLIFVSVVFFNRELLFPGWWATLPVVGTVLLIAAGPGAWFNQRVLSLRGFVFVGLISYPLYLWHWPLLSFVRIVEAGAPSTLLIIQCIFLAFVLSWVTYQFVEKRLRHNSVSRVVVGLVVSLAMVGFVGRIIESKNGFPERIAVAHYQSFDKQLLRESATDSTCDKYVDSRNEKRKFYYCRANDLQQDKWIALVGDSHSHVLFPGFSEQAALRGYGTILLANTGCPPLIDTATGKTESDRSQCVEKRRQILRLVEKEDKIKKVVFAIRGPVYISGREFYRSRQDSRIIHFQSVNNSSLPLVDVFFTSLYKTLQQFVDSGKMVGLFLENPEMGIRPQDTNKRPFTFSQNQPRFQVPYDQYLSRMGEYRQRMINIHALLPAIKILDPEDLFCDHAFCLGILEGELMYTDDDHLSVAGSRYVARNMAPLLFE